ncbi:hypothetical protein D3C76_1340170 [compost metagenome]
MQEGAAIVEQLEVAAMVGGDVDGNVKAILHQRSVGGQAVRGVQHQRPGHVDDLPAVLGIGDEQVRAYQAFLRVVPAHQHFGACPAVIVLAHHRLEIRQKLVGLQGAAQFGTWRVGAADLPATGDAGHRAQQQQQAEQRRVVAAQQLARGAFAVAAVHAERVARRTLRHFGDRGAG